MTTPAISIVGGGLVGSMAALLLAETFNVTIYEKRPDPRSTSNDQGRSINLILTARGLAALEQAGCRDAAVALGAPVYGRIIHDRTGQLKYQPYGRDKSLFNYSIPRLGINQLLLTQAEQRGVALHFGWELKAAHPENNLLDWQAPHGPVSLPSAMTIGADGGGSQLRQCLDAQYQLGVSTEPLGHSYKELSISAVNARQHKLNLEALHIWPRGQLMLMGLPNRDGSITMTLYLPDQGSLSFAALQTAEDVHNLFAEHFADALPMMPDLAAEFLGNPVGFLGTVRCDNWQAGTMCLMGDAAHAIVPFFGQGMNCGFEDCQALARHLSGTTEAQEALARFWQERKPQTDAIATMSLENFQEMAVHVGEPQFLLRKAVEHLIEQRWPGIYNSRYALVSYTQTPYREAYERGQRQQAFLNNLCNGISHPEQVDWTQAEAGLRALGYTTHD